MDNTETLIQCPKCGTPYNCPLELLGTVGTCRPCGIEFEIKKGPDPVKPMGFLARLGFGLAFIFRGGRNG